jgi:small subunit ribosomal protein S16
MQVRNTNKVIIIGFAACRWPGGYVACLKRSKENSPHPKEHIMVVIRLSRGGAKARPFYNIVVADKRTRRDGNFIERLGFYNPIAIEGEEGLRIAQDRLTYWKSVGAQASPTVERLVAQLAAKTKAA